MAKLEINNFSKKYSVRKLKLDDVKLVYEFCKANTQYYDYCQKEPSVELIENDLTITPPGIPAEQKYYVGFFQGNELVAVMDLIDGYPETEYVFIGFFMMNKNHQGTGIGSSILCDVFDYLRSQGYKKCQLGIDKENPQSNHFWKKNGFAVIREVAQEEGMILVAERTL